MVLLVGVIRFVARRGLTNLKRYQIDRVFLASAAGGGVVGHPKEVWEADFDIMADSGSPNTTVGVSEIKKQKSNQVMGTFEAYLGPWCLRLGNVKMSQALLDLCGVPAEAR
ncbi:unnamed protein product, partial [Discosporangium mesarthrocarpum]